MVKRTRGYFVTPDRSTSRKLLLQGNATKIVVTRGKNTNIIFVCRWIFLNSIFLVEIVIREDAFFRDRVGKSFLKWKTVLELEKKLLFVEDVKLKMRIDMRLKQSERLRNGTIISDNFMFRI